MKHLLTFNQFLNEAEAPKLPAPAPQPPQEDEDENKPATPPSAPAAPGAEPATTDTPAADGATPPADGTGAAGDIPDASGAAPGADASATDSSTPGTDATGGAAGGASGADGSSTAGTPDASGLGSAPTSSGSAGSSSSGASLGDPLDDEGTETPPTQGDDQPKAEKPEDYVPPVSKFNMVFMDKNAKWEQEYPNGGGVKEMDGYEVSWKDLNKWIDQNKLGAKKQEIAEFLMGEKDDLDNDVKVKLKNAFSSKTLGDDTGNQEVEFDDDLTPYVQDINTIIVDL